MSLSKEIRKYLSKQVIEEVNNHKTYCHVLVLRILLPRTV